MSPIGVFNIFAVGLLILVPPTTSRRIIGGDPNSPLRNLHESVVWVTSNHNGCSGTIIGPRHVLTAAHCLLHSSTPEPLPPNFQPPVITIVYNCKDGFIGGGTDLTGCSSAMVQQAFAHPAFQIPSCHCSAESYNRNHDVAVLQMHDSFTGFNSHAILRVDGVHSTLSDTNTSVIVAGYGTSVASEPGP
jgi:hypothetical protein